MPFDHLEKMPRLVKRQSRFRKMRILRDEISRPAMHICKVAPAATRNKDLSPRVPIVFEHHHPSPTLARYRRAHQPSSSRAQNNHIELANRGIHGLLSRIAAESVSQVTLPGDRERAGIKRNLIIASIVPEQLLAVLPERSAGYHHAEVFARRKVIRQRPGKKDVFTGFLADCIGDGFLPSPVSANVDHAVNPYVAHRLGVMNARQHVRNIYGSIAVVATERVKQQNLSVTRRVR